ncbi:MAG: TIGR01777 family oxidoreductase [Puniceicoccaceae bacterium]
MTLRVLVSGSSGFIGRQLVARLRQQNHEVFELSRSGAGENSFHWDPDKQELDEAALTGMDVVIHLAGENIASGRWTRARKARILDSRIQGTRLLVDRMSDQEEKPSVFISASGVNVYEESGFLATVCREWEKEAMRATELGIRTVCVRTGIVLDPEGGALKKMLPAFRLGMGGPVGKGTQAFPWISMRDLVALYLRIVEDDQLHGAVNAVHPQMPSQREFAQILGRVLNRPARIPLPAASVRLLFGQMGEETLLADPVVQPGILEETGHTFLDDSLESCLKSLLKA